MLGLVFRRVGIVGEGLGYCKPIIDGLKGSRVGAVPQKGSMVLSLVSAVRSGLVLMIENIYFVELVK